MMSWVGCLLKDSELFILFAENSQILVNISVIPILLSGSKQPTEHIVHLNSLLGYIIVTMVSEHYYSTNLGLASSLS